MFQSFKVSKVVPDICIRYHDVEWR